MKKKDGVGEQPLFASKEGGGGKIPDGKKDQGCAECGNKILSVIRGNHSGDESDGGSEELVESNNIFTTYLKRDLEGYHDYFRSENNFRRWLRRLTERVFSTKEQIDN